MVALKVSINAIDGEAATTAAVMNVSTPARPHRIPLWLKIAYAAFLAVMIPAYWINYGPTNFLYFCDVALLFTLVGIWKEDALLISLPAVGILLPQFIWCADFLVQAFGGKLTGMTGYMFDEKLPVLLRGLSLFHGWLPFLLFYLVKKLGYDRRALAGWFVICVALCLASFWLLPPAGALLADPKTPRNINYVFGMDDMKPQQWVDPGTYVFLWITVLTALVFVPTHFLLKNTCKPVTA